MSDKLISKLSSKRSIRSAWNVVRKNRFVAPGLDKVTVSEFEANINSHLDKISKQIKNQKYTFQSSRKVSIPKGSDTRDIHVFTIRDKIVQQAIQTLFVSNSKSKALFPDVYNEVGVAYIPRVNGVARAVSKVKKLHSEGYIYLSTLDIEDFFDKIDAQDLYKKIKANLPDESLDWLIEKTLNNKVFYDGEIDDVSGVLQGAVLAPLYSNIYLSDFDQKVHELKIPAIRYADDMAIFSKSSEIARQDCIKVRKLLKEEVGLDFYPHDHKLKPSRIRCINDFAEFLGIHFSLGSRKRLTIQPSPSKVKSQKKKISDTFYPLDELNIARSVIGVNRSTNSWFTHYSSAGCHSSPMRSCINEIYNHYSSVVTNALQKIGIMRSSKKLTKEQLLAIGLFRPEDMKKKR